MVARRFRSTNRERCLRGRSGGTSKACAWRGSKTWVEFRLMRGCGRWWMDIARRLNRWGVPSLVPLDRGIRLFELDLAGAGGLDFGARQHQAGLKALHQKIVMTRRAVVAQELEIGFFSGQILLSTRGSPAASSR